MAHPGLAFAFVVGAGLAAILYYIFNDNNDQHSGAHNNDSRSDSRPSRPDSWNSSNKRSNYRDNRRDPGHSYCEVDCAICLMELAGLNITKIAPCGHSFHKKCIQNWQLQSDLAGHDSCPVCRSKIRTE